ncbi:hypothetical protein FRC09_007345 [Ceratobasidium sp. 395]|nr:hypothetical protein FRC09_007345 [Ceratobasidium sp. 395]
MSISQARDCYGQLASNIFSDKNLISLGGPAFKASKLEQILQSIIEQRTGDPHEQMMTSWTNHSECKVFVCATSGHNTNAGIPRIMRTYAVPDNQTPNYTICETLRATTTHPDLFESVELGSPPAQEVFVDGGLGCHNPIDQLIAEAKLTFPGRHISTIISIGAGHMRTVQIPKAGLFKSTLPLNALIAAKRMATECERAAEEAARRFQNFPNVYFRFNIDQDLQNVGQSSRERLDEVTAHAEGYLQRIETSKQLSSAAEAIMARQCVVATHDIDKESQVPTPRKPVSMKTYPSSSPMFTGREEDIQKITSYFSDGPTGRKVFVLHGLGGTGKTQIALRFIEANQDRFADIIYVDASSRETVVSSLKSFAEVKGLGQADADLKEWISTLQEPWLLVFNNADGSDVDLRDYFLTESYGNILITTRNRDLVLLSQGANATCEVSGLPYVEATQLLLRIAKIQDGSLPQEEALAASELVADFGCVALAVAQAGAYIRRTGCSITNCRDTYHKRRQELLKEYKNRLVDMNDYPEVVYTTWTMSYERLGPCASELLRLIVFFHHDNVPEAMFQRASEGLTNYEPMLPFSEHETSIHNWVKEFLGSFNSSDNLWDSRIFQSVMSEILSYSLIEYDQPNRTYFMHPLVRDWARSIVPDASLTLERAAHLLAVSVDLNQGSMDDFGFGRILTPHVDQIIEQLPQVNTNNAARYANVYQEAGRELDAGALFEGMLPEVRKVLGDENPKTLTLMSNMAVIRYQQGRWREAEVFFSNCIEPMKRVLGESHPSTLFTMTNLATAYLSQGRLSDAETLANEVFEKLQLNDITAATASTIFFALRTLSDIYRKQGRWDLAEQVQIQLLEACREQLGVDHPGTLKCMGELAATYTEQYRWDEAEELQTHVALTMKRTLGDRHPSTLSSLHALAQTYEGQKNFEQATKLLSQVLQVSQEVLGLRHPDTLSTLGALAKVYGEQDNWKEAEPLFQLALTRSKEVHGDEHPQTLHNMNNLAAAYLNLGRPGDAQPLQEQVLTHRTRLFGETNPDTLTSMNALAATHLKLGELDKAEALQLRATNGRVELLGPEHPRTLTSIHNLGQVYLAQGRILEAAEQERRVWNGMKELYGPLGLSTVTSMATLCSMYLEGGLFREAELLQLELIGLLTKERGEGDAATLLFMRHLADNYKLQGRHSEHEALVARVAELEGSTE